MFDQRMTAYGRRSAPVLDVPTSNMTLGRCRRVSHLPLHHERRLRSYSIAVTARYQERPLKTVCIFEYCQFLRHLWKDLQSEDIIDILTKRAFKWAIMSQNISWFSDARSRWMWKSEVPSLDYHHGGCISMHIQFHTTQLSQMDSLDLQNDCGCLFCL